MTDEKIKEEFEKYLDGDINTTATMFGYRYETARKGSKAGYKNMAQGFYAGFRAAERLAKIEELKKLDAEIVNMLDDDYTTMSCHLTLRISELERGH